MIETKPELVCTTKDMLNNLCIVCFLKFYAQSHLLLVISLFGAVFAFLGRTQLWVYVSLLFICMSIQFTELICNDVVCIVYCMYTVQCVRIFCFKTLHLNIETQRRNQYPLLCIFLNFSDTTRKSKSAKIYLGT